MDEKQVFNEVKNKFIELKQIHKTDMFALQYLNEISYDNDKTALFALTLGAMQMCRIVDELETKNLFCYTSDNRDEDYIKNYKKLIQYITDNIEQLLQIELKGE